MRSIPRLAPVLLLVLAPALSACGGDSDNTTDDAAPPSSSTPSVPPTSEPTKANTSADSESESASTDPSDGELPPACEVLTPADVKAAYGVDFGDGEVGGGGTSESGVEWQSDNCDWEAADLVEVQLAISGPDDFETGFTCPEPAGKGETVTSVSLGPPAAGSWWIVDDEPPLEATLRACTPNYLVEIGLDFEDGTDFKGDPQAQTIGLATLVLQKLG